MIKEFKSYPATYLIILICTSFYFFLEYKGGTEDLPGNLRLIKYGARHVTSINQGEWWRLIVPIFMHIGFLHIFSNTACLIIVGRIIEKIFGSTGYILVFIITGILSNICSYFFSSSNPLAVGAGMSGSIFGLFGIYIAYLILNKSELGDYGKNMLILCSVFVGANIFIDVISNSINIFGYGIDTTAHFSGLISGLLIGFYFFINKNRVFNLLSINRDTNSISLNYRYIVTVIFTIGTVLTVLNIK